MKKTKVIGISFLILAVYTIIGMILNNDAFWAVYNYITLGLSIISGVMLVREK